MHKNSEPIKVFFNPWIDAHRTSIQKFSFYFTENTVPVYYKDQLVSAA